MHFATSVLAAGTTSTDPLAGLEALLSGIPILGPILAGLVSTVGGLLSGLLGGTGLGGLLGGL